MLELNDFYHLPQLEAQLERLVNDDPGLIVIAGLDPRPGTPSGGTDGLLPSGRPTIFRILMRQLLEDKPRARAVVVAEHKDAVRISRQLRRQVEFSLVRPPYTYAGRIADAAKRRPDLLVVDHLVSENAGPALEAAQGGLRVLTQIDTVFRGGEVVRSMLELGASDERLGGLAWVVTVQRFPMLCPRCKRETPVDPALVNDLERRYPGVIHQEAGKSFLDAAGCSYCQYTGRHGDLSAFDIFRASAERTSLTHQASQLSLEEYVLRLATAGHLSLTDFIELGSDQLRRTYNMLTASERALGETNASLLRKLAELEAANRVLQQRTEALVSLQEVGQALISSTDLDDLSSRVCRRACDICCADLAVLYYLSSPTEAEILGVSGWDQAYVRQRLDAEPLLKLGPDLGPVPFDELPPGVASGTLPGDGRTIRAGLAVPLVAQNERVGFMLVHSTQAARFAPGEISLLQTFAVHAALAIQRASLITQLRGKIDELEKAQIQLAQKERLERELELARQVQQSVLPRSFPEIPGYRFGAEYRSARQVGGDFYDVIRIDADHFGVVVGDVSDKGMPSALYMALTRSLLLAEARRNISPRAVLASVNQLLLELGNPDMFVTVFYGVVETGTGNMVYTRAGHDYPFLLRGNEALELGGHGTILGMFDQIAAGLTEEQISLEANDRLVLYTDGLTDAISENGRLYDRHQLRSVLGALAAESPANLCSFAFSRLREFQGSAEQFDDMTMLVVAVD